MEEEHYFDYDLKGAARSLCDGNLDYLAPSRKYSFILFGVAYEV